MAQLFDDGIFSVIDAASAIQVGAKLYWYVANTTTPTITYADPDLNVENANPVLASGDGRFPQMWLAPGNYKYVLTAPDSTPADPLVTVDEFSVPDNPPSFDPALDDFLAGDEPLRIENGGTGETSAANAIAALGGLSTAGGTMEDNIIFEGAGVAIYWDNAAMVNGNAFLTVDSDPDPTALAGEIWLKYT